MRLSKRNLVIICCLIAVVIVAAGLFALAENLSLRPEADIKMAQDLAVLSGMSKETVLELYDAVGSWDTVRDNIFVYKRILDLVKNDAGAYAEAFEVIAGYDAGNVLTVYEFLANNDRGFKQAKRLLGDHAKGTSMEAVLASASDDKEYKFYKPAGEDQVRRWLGEGFLPQDILNADMIGRAKDKSITHVLSMKNDTNTWEQVGKKFGYKFDESIGAAASIKVRGATGTLSFKGDDYEEAVKKANAKAEQDRVEMEKKICRESGLSIEQIDEYKNQGLTVWDIQNALRLAQKSGDSIDKILQERKDGKDWKAIIKTYSG